MVKRIVAACDNPEAHGPDELVDASEVVLSIGGPPLGVDLCPDCRKALVAPLEALLAEYGQPLGEGYKLPTRAKRGPYKPRVDLDPDRASYCPVPDCGWSGDKSGLHGHTKSQHGAVLSVLEGHHGRLHADGTREILSVRCEVKGCGAAYADPRGLSVHNRLEHS